MSIPYIIAYISNAIIRDYIIPYIMSYKINVPLKLGMVSENLVMLTFFSGKKLLAHKNNHQELLEFIK